jgi:hypothetical protein
VEAQAVTGEIARLEALLGADPGARAYPALAEANRRAGRLEEAERVAREGLRRQPDLLSGRVALAWLSTQRRRPGSSSESSRTCRTIRSLAASARAGARPRGSPTPRSKAFGEAEAALGEMVDANHVAARAAAAGLDEPGGLPRRPGLARRRPWPPARARDTAPPALREARGSRGAAPAPIGATETDRPRWLGNLRKTT